MTATSIMRLVGLCSIILIYSSCAKDESPETAFLTNGEWIYQDVNSSTNAVNQAFYDRWVDVKINFLSTGIVVTTFKDGRTISGGWEWEDEDSKEIINYLEIGDLTQINKGVQWRVVELGSNRLIVKQGSPTLQFSH